MMDAFKKIAKNEGFTGLYKGFVPGIWGVSHCAVKFMIYEELKSKCYNVKKQPITSKLGFFENLACGGISQFLLF
jgi:solute carrier family 25 folate transporter 32